MSLRRWLPYATLALAAHLAGIGAAVLVPARGTASTSVDTVAADLDVELAPAAETAAPALPAPVAPVEAPAARATSTAATRAMRETTAPSGGNPEPSAMPSAAPPPADDGWTFDPRRPADMLAPAAIAQAAREGLPAATTEPATPPRAPTGVSKTGGLAEGLDAHDASLGMGRGGPVVSALEVAAASSDAAEGSATFDVAIDASGRVSVALLSASTARGAWTHVGAAASTSLDPKRIRIPPGAQGWHVVAMVEAKMQYANGLEPKKLGTHVQGSASLTLKENEHRENVTDPPIVFDKLPGITVAHVGKVCSVAFTLGLTFASGISGGCDPSNIGSRPLRVVRGHVVSEGRL